MTTFDLDPTQNDGRPTRFQCDCGRAFRALPPLNPLHGPSFFDGDQVVSHCPEGGLDLAWVLRTATPAGPGPRADRPAPRPDGAARSSFEQPAGEAPRLPAGPLGAVLWSQTLYPDGRIVLEVPE